MNGSKKSIRTDYLHPDAPLGDFYSYPPNQPDFERIIQNRSQYPADRDTLVEVIQAQYEGLPLYEETKQALKKLASPTCFTVTTGHQLVFLGGPLFTTYKVLHTIKLAEELSRQYPDKSFVPIFWIHTEDHDFEEINHYYPSFEEKRVYEGHFEGKVGQHLIEESIASLLPTHFSSKLTASYSPENSWADAYRAFMHQLFGPKGVLMLDADDPRLKRQFIPTIRKELMEHISQDRVSRTSNQLLDLGYHPQVTPREINLFYMEGPYRNRIVEEEGVFKVVDTSLSWEKEDFLQLLEEHPERISPNVCLRPLYQETILPNLAYIGGWGELSYWLQLKELFAAAAVHFPLVLPRMSLTLFREEEARKWNALGLSPEDIDRPLIDIHRKLTHTYWKREELQSHLDSLKKGYADLQHYVEQFSATLPRSVDSQLTKNKRFFTRLEKKIQKVIIHSHSEFEKITQLKETIQPDRRRQERILSLASFPGYDLPQLIDQLYEHCEPLNYTPSFYTLST